MRVFLDVLSKIKSSTLNMTLKKSYGWLIGVVI